MRRIIGLIAGALLAAAPLSAQGTDQLLPARKRITDEAIARDWALIQKWLARAESLPRNPGDRYARARAINLLEFVATEYDRANRSPVLDTAFVHAVAIVQRIEAGQTWYQEAQEPAGAAELAPDLWPRIDSLQAADVSHCAEGDIAKAQVKLLLAVEEHRTGGPECSAPVIKEVEALIDEMKRQIAACAPKPADTARVEAPPAPEPEAPEVVKIPAEVHFAFDRSTLSPATTQVLDQLATQLVALPDAEITLDAFADPQGQPEYNRRLSARRGEAVRQYLVSKGVAPSRILVIPLGATAPDRNPGLPRLERYALDRRVDIRAVTKGNVVIERYEQYADVQATAQPRGTRGRAKPSGRNQVR